MGRLVEEERRARFDARQLGADCSACPLSSSAPVFPEVNTDARLIICGEAPGEHEEEEGRPFVGHSGKFLEATCREIGVERVLDLHVTNALLCRPHRKLGPAEWKQALVCCRPRLHRELLALPCRHVAACGARALQTFTGHAKIFPYLGAPLAGSALEAFRPRAREQQHQGLLVSFRDFTVLPSLHPAFGLRSPGYLPVIQTHIARAWALAVGQLKPWKWPKFHIRVSKPMEQALKRILASDKPVAVDVETQGIDPWTAPVMCIGLSNGKDTVSVPWRSYSSKRYGNVRGLYEYTQYRKTIRHLVERVLQTKQLVFQNGNYDLTSLHADHLDVPVKHWFFDTLPAHALAAPRLRHDLQLQACIEFPLPDSWKTKFGTETDAKGGDKFTEQPEETLRDYNAKDALCTIRLVDPLRRRLKEDTNQGVALMARAMDLLRGPAFAMSARGVLVDQTRFAAHHAAFTEKMGAARADLNAVAQLAGTSIEGEVLDEGAETNPHSGPQLRRLFFKTLGAQPTKFTPLWAPSLDEEALKDMLASQNTHVRAGAESLLRYRRWKKLDDYLGMSLDTAGALHVFWRPSFGARTGRWSSSPNLQNIPKPKLHPVTKEVVAPGLRDIFVARPSMWLVEADKKQLELRIAATLAGCKGLLDIFARDGDVHREVAAGLFARSNPADVTKDERDLTKTWHYAAIYGAEVENIWRRMIVDFPNLPLGTVIRMYNEWFARFHEIRAWQLKSVAAAYRLGYVEVPIDGRRQYYLDGKIDKNEVLNFPVQGTGAGILDPEMLALHADRRMNWKRNAILIQAHDSIMLECQDPEEGVAMLVKHMERKVTLSGSSVLFPVDVKIGRCWAYMVEPKSRDTASIRAAAEEAEAKWLKSKAA